MRKIVLLIVLLSGLCAWAREEKDSLCTETGREEDMLAQLREKAEEGDTEAMNFLGYLLVSGDEGVEQDLAEGLRWIRKAADAGDVKAASNLGWLFLEGELVEKDSVEGAKWIAKAAEAGLPVAQSILGDLYLQGRGVARDTLAADSLYRNAFEHGLADAGYKLYALNAERYAFLAPEEKVTEGKYYYLRGAPSEGVKLFYLAAEEGSADAMALLGDAYSRAIGAPYDYELSKKYYVEAALAGNPSAQFVIGELLEIFPDALNGNEEWSDVSNDPFLWYERAAEQGVTDADTAMRLLLQ